MEQHINYGKLSRMIDTVITDNLTGLTEVRVSDSSRVETVSIEVDLAQLLHRAVMDRFKSSGLINLFQNENFKGGVAKDLAKMDMTLKDGVLMIEAIRSKEANQRMADSVGVLVGE